MSAQKYPTLDPPPTYVEFYRLFADALAGKGDVPVKPEDASRVIRIVELVRESDETGRSMDF